MTNYEKPIQARQFGAAFSPDLVQVIWRRKWWLTGCLLISLALGAAYLTRVEPSYRVQARVLIQQHGLPLDQKRPSATSEEFLATQAEIIRSPAVVGRAAQSLKLTPRGNPPVDPTTWILESLSVIPVTGTHVLSISFVGPDAEQATRTVEAVIAAYREYLLGSEHDTNLEAVRMLTQSEKDLREELRGHGLQYRQLRKDSPLAHRLGQGLEHLRRCLATTLAGRGAESPQRIETGQAEIYREIRRARMHRRPLALMTVRAANHVAKATLDRFAGQLAAEMTRDYIAARIAAFLDLQLSDCDVIVQRDDHWVVLLPETGRDMLDGIAQKLKTAAKEQLDLEFEFGLSVFPDEEITFAGLLEHAESSSVDSRHPASSGNGDLPKRAPRESKARQPQA